MFTLLLPGSSFALPALIGLEEKFGFNCVIQTKRVGDRLDLTRMFAQQL